MTNNMKIDSKIKNKILKTSLSQRIRKKYMTIIYYEPFSTPTNI